MGGGSSAVFQSQRHDRPCSVTPHYHACVHCVLGHAIQQRGLLHWARQQGEGWQRAHTQSQGLRYTPSHANLGERQSTSTATRSQLCGPPDCSPRVPRTPSLPCTKNFSAAAHRKLPEN